ncbi:MAG TPA: BTAD domain-containing putative transcriptional regulator [Rhizomicrobium sp.]|jgi:DNA-binding SARP family transcriptional activator/TolB-like protein
MLERIFQEPKFRVCCLGGIKLIEAGSNTDMTPAGRKTRALLGYLCIVGKPVGRERLASLLWGDRGDEQARASLRQAIYELRSLLGGEHLIKVERDTVAVGDDVGTDLAAILAAAHSGDLEELGHALAAWRGDFLEDLSSIDISFDAWLRTERLRVQESLIGAATEAVKSGMARGEVDAARKIVNLLQQHDGTNEVVVRLGLRLDHLAGDSGGLHRRYERFRELLKAELNAAPSVETKLLFDELTAKSSAVEIPVASLSSDDTLEEAPPPPVSAPLPERIDAELIVPVQPAVSNHWPKFVVALLAISALCLVIWFVWSAWYKAAPPRVEPLLAVMPFQGLSTDSDSRAFAGGISNEIADALRQTTKIRVAPAPSGFPHANAPAATHVLSGSVERTGGKLHVIVQLMDITDDRVVWGHAYDRALSQTPELRHDVATQIAGALGKLLTSDSFSQVPMGSAAYDHYLKGRSLFRQNEPDAASAELEDSIRLAPGFANAWSSLATVRLRLARDTHDSSLAHAASAAAERAIALDPNNGEAQGVLAMLMPSTHLIEIDRQFERALRAQPDNTQLLVWHGEFLMYVGRSHEALDELKRAYILDRTTPDVAANLALAALRSGRLDEAKEILDILGPGTDDASRLAYFNFHMKYFLYHRNWFGLANYLTVMPERISPQLAAFLRLCRDTATAFATHETGRLDGLHADWRREASIDPDDATQFLSALDDYDGSMDAIQPAAKSSRNNTLLTDPKWEALFVPNLLALRRDPHFDALLTQWGLSDYWRVTNHLPDYMR